uniref:Uncharacterized protein n=1 Tax=Salmo trutta TaxID=8032 RepID=A0A673XN46_SALTR
MCGNNNTASWGLTNDGCNLFRQTPVLSTLNCKRVKIQNIRSKEDNTGLRGKWATKHRRSITRTVLFYLLALWVINLVFLLMLAPFMKNPLKAVLKGVTNDPMDFSVRPCSLNTLKILCENCWCKNVFKNRYD